MATNDTRTLGEEALKNISAIAAEQTELMKAEDISVDQVKEMTPEEAARLREQKIVKLSQILNKGHLNSQLQALVDEHTPEGRVGRLVLNRETSIAQYERLGYTFDVKKGLKSPHAQADNIVRIGDLVLMTIAREDHELLLEVNRRRVNTKVSGEARKEYLSRADSESAAPAFDESQTQLAR